MKKRGYDVICVGSATVDVFVDTGNILKKHENCLLLEAGDKVDINKLNISTGGGGTNTAYNFSKLGLNSAFLGCIGDDLHGHVICKVLEDAKVDCIGKIKEGCSGYSIIMDAKNHDRTILAYKGVNNLLTEKDVPYSKIKKVSLIYFSSLLGNSFLTGQKIAQFAQENKIPVAFNASSYLVEKGKKFLKKFLENTNIFILNKQEAQTLLNKKVNDIKYLLYYVKDLLNFNSIIVITDGKEGAYLYDGRQYFHVQPRKIKIKEATGAGDGFASAFVVGLMKKKDILTSLQMGQIEAEYLIQTIGAKCNLTSSKMSELLKKNPPKVIQI